MPRLSRFAPRLALALAGLWLAACQALPPSGPTPAPPTVVPASTPTAAPSPTLIRPTPKPTAGVVPTPPPLETPVAGAASLDSRFGVAEGFRDPAAMAELGAGWERVVLSWADIQPDGPDDFSWLGRTVPPKSLTGELRRGVRVAGLLQFTPDWAATDLRDPGRSVPRNLYLPDDDPRNYWARFVFETVRYYSGRIDEWIVWNEPEFRPDDAAGTGSYTWLGSDADFARLMQVAYRAAKRANPRATISFPGTSYWVDQNIGRPQFYERFLRLLADDPRARDNRYYHDAVSLNLYRAPDDLVRVHQTIKDIQRRSGIDVPVWLLELNAMPTDDTSIPCASMHAANPIQTTQEQQAAYAIQALSLAAAVGYQRISFYQMVDDNPCRQSAVWGITRDDGSRRPVAQTLTTAIHTLSGFLTAQFVPTVRPRATWSAWPGDPGSLLPNWQIYQVALDMPGQQRVTVLWNGDGSPMRVRVPRRGSASRLLDESGAPLALNTTGQDYLIDLPPASAHYSGDPVGYYFIGGAPRLLVEHDVSPGAPVTPARVT